MILKRAITEDVLQGAKYFSVVAILGSRQSGKKTLAQQLFPHQHAYLSLEDLDLRAAARQDPRTILSANASQHGLIIDEFQYVPELLFYIQTIADRDQSSGAEEKSHIRVVW